MSQKTEASASNDKSKAEMALKEYIKLKPSDDKIQSYKNLLDQ